jgi:hypothetical protein
VTVRPLSPDEETEPDDRREQALPIELERPMRGWLHAQDDVDYYAAHGPGGGTLSATITGIAGVDLRVVVLPPAAATGAAPATPGGPPGALPPGAKVFDEPVTGAGFHLDGVPWPAGAPGPVLVVMRRPPHAREVATEPHPTLVGRDQPYTLTVRLKR